MNIFIYLTLVGFVFAAPIEKDAIGTPLVRPWMGEQLKKLLVLNLKFLLVLVL